MSESEFVFGWERIVTRGTKPFQDGHVEVLIKASQTFWAGEEMVIELPMWRVEDAALRVGVSRVAFWGSGRDVILNVEFVRVFGSW